MRVAVFTESYEPIVNGVSVSVAALRDGMRARGHEVHVFAPDFAGHPESEFDYRFPSRISRYSHGYPIPIPFAPKIWRRFMALKPDIVHTQTPFILGQVGRRWARRLGVPLVSTNHTMYAEYSHYIPFLTQTWSRALLINLMRLYYSRCDAVVVPSRAVADLLRSYGIKTDIEVIKSGVTASTSNHKQDVRESFGIAEGDFLLLYVGRVAKEKNLGLLIKAFELVRANHDNARLMVVGSGPDQAPSEKLAASLGLSDAVRFTGMLSRETVAGIYSAADAFVFPSTTETQGLVVCEALTTGLPCVAVRAAATPEVLEEGVDSLLTENTETAFAEATGRLIADPELRARLSAGALRNAPKFSVAAMAEHFEKFYQSVIDGKRG